MKIYEGARTRRFDSEEPEIPVWARIDELREKWQKLIGSEDGEDEDGYEIWGP
jgi:hypothetical protein